MNERLPYEEQLVEQINSLSLPDENMAWADMKRRLEEDDDDGIIVWWRRGCMVWGFLLLALAGMGWWFLQPQKWFSSKNTKVQITVVKHSDTVIGKIGDKTDETTNTKDAGQNSTEMITAEIDNIDSAGNAELKNVEKGNNFQKKILTRKENAVIMPDVSGKLRVNKNRNLVKAKQSGKIEMSKKKSVFENENSQPDSINSEKTVVIKTADTLSDAIQKIIVNKTDSVSSSTIKLDSTNKIAERKDTTTAKTDSSKRKPVFFSAGIALQQQIPLAGQNFVPYSAFGRRGTLTDYIPSIYIRVNKDKKWFLQSELKYGAPQLVKDVLYDRNIDSTNPLKPITTSLQLQKTYYHQASVSFNYFIFPNLSFGGGIIWNRFSSAISLKDVIQRDRLTGLDSVISQGLIIRSKKADTTFIKSYFQAMAETQYKWKRYSFGIKYSFGLQPYIKFTLPGGTRQEEKNSSLQLFIRYELWRSKEKH